MIGVFLCVPGRFSTGHFYNGTADTPHITAPPILLSSEDLKEGGVLLKKQEATL